MDVCTQVSRPPCAYCEEPLDRGGTTVVGGALVHASCQEGYRNQLDAETQEGNSILTVWKSKRAEDAFGVYHTKGCECPDCLLEAGPDVEFYEYGSDEDDY